MTSICIVTQSVYERDPRVRRKAEALVSAGYVVDVLSLRSGDRGPAKTFTLNGVNVRTLALGKKRGSLGRYAFEYSAFFLWTLLRTTVDTRRRGYAAIDVNTLPDCLVFAAVFARWMGAGLLLDMHEITPEFFMSRYGMAEDSWAIKALKYLENKSFTFADGVITISEPVQDLLIGRGLPLSKSIVVMNAADESRLTPDAARPLDHRLPGSSTFVLMYHGTLTRIYGLDLAVEAFALARDEMPGAELWILGSGPEAAALADLVEHRGLTSQVRLIGHVPADEIPAWLRACDVGILPIRRDVFLDYAFPNKLPEFVVAGKPVLVSRLAGIRHYFSERALAYCEPNDPAALGREMVRLYAEPQRRDQLAAQAKEEYAPIRWDLMKQRYLQLVDRISGRAPIEVAGSPPDAATWAGSLR